ncbi:hypothetical protein F5X68DRAFT_131370 [Plectosphaerella plurivora]|uniref:Short-chain dehydrogenase/reductase 3 n=1 Tax=Plectosphaerella plurivora TaxID=936078 RepID=A0A9P8VG59_9PEZI|nr:hypothetical protein F5X68DRAFT_131370 [Plectosphaerella plurivora]
MNTAETVATAVACGVAGIAAVGLGVWAHKALNKRALNNGTKADFDWNHEIVLITGGAGGIGGETVKHLAQKGNKIVVLDILPMTYDAPPNVYYYKCDLTKYENVLEVADKIRLQVGNPTVIIANAGICRGQPILHAEKRDISLTFEVNTFGLLWTIKTFLPSLVAKNHGHLLIVASQTAFITSAGVTDYCASKAAALSIYEGVHSEMKHIYEAPAVRVSCISPSHVKTGMFAGIKSVPGMSSLTPESIAKTIGDILYSGNAHNIMVPKLAYASKLTRLMPEWFRIAAQDIAAGAFTTLRPHDPMAKSQ